MITGGEGRITQQLEESSLRTQVGTFSEWTLDINLPIALGLPNGAFGTVCDVWYDDYLFHPELPVWLELSDGRGSYQVMPDTRPEVGELSSWKSVASAAYVPKEL